MPKRSQAQDQRPLAAIVEIDQEILRLLTRRHNILAKLRSNGRLDAADEKFLRESWQNDVARVSRDPELSARFFSLMQQISFLPKPGGGKEVAANAQLPGAKRREAFNLAPPGLPIQAELTAPLAGRQTRAWLYLAVQAGVPVKIGPCLQNDAIIDFVRSLAQLGGAITRDNDMIATRAATPLPSPDKVIHIGDSAFNFYLILAHYLGRPSRAKFTGGPKLTIANFSILRQFLPALGCRLINVIPKNDGLPARIEASGMLPDAIICQTDLPAGFVEALILAAPGYSQPISIDLSAHKQSQLILNHTMPILKASEAKFSLQNNVIRILPGIPTIPTPLDLPLDPLLACLLMSFGNALSGKIMLKGHWPALPECESLWQICSATGWIKDQNELIAEFKEPAVQFSCAEITDCPEWQKPVLACLAACACLAGGHAKLPPAFADDPDIQDFLRICSLVINSDGSLQPGAKYDGLAWNAPSPGWAAALAIAACRRPDRKCGWPLGNPGIMTELWPAFWNFYNSLPTPIIGKKAMPKEPEPKNRRKIITSQIAVVPKAVEQG